MTIQFRLQAQAEAQCLPRLLDQFAQRGLIPSAVVTNHVGSGLDIVIEHPTIEDDVAELLCERMRRITTVEQASAFRVRRS